MDSFGTRLKFQDFGSNLCQIKLKTLWCVQVVLLEDVVNSATTARVLATRERAGPGKVQRGRFLPLCGLP